MEETIQSLAKRRKPQSVINELGVAHRKSLLEVRGFAIDSEALEFLVRHDQERAAGSFVSTSGLHAHQTVFHDVHATNAVASGDFVEQGEEVDGAENFA